MKQKILDTLQEVVSNFLYYDRKDDQSLPMCAIEEAIKNKVITVDDIVNEFKAQLLKELE